MNQTIDKVPEQIVGHFLRGGIAFKYTHSVLNMKLKKLCIKYDNMRKHANGIETVQEKTFWS